jgi:RNA polymerase sigma factor (TIGR02999 family)
MDEGKPHDITGLLLAWRGGDEDALADLMPLVYVRLKAIAGRLVRQERQGHTLETTALVHESYLRLVDLERISWRDRAHFFAMCARIMRRVLVDRARYHGREKRGARAQRVETAEMRRLVNEREPSLIALDDALRELAVHDTQMAQIVELRFFGGLDRRSIGEVLGISSATVTRRWRSARAWLITYMQRDFA